MTSIQSLVFLPQPRSLIPGSATLALQPDQMIALAVEASPTLYTAVQSLQTTLRNAAHVEWSITTTSHDSGVGALLRIAPQWVTQNQGYALTITPSGIVIDAHDAAGLFYAINTLIQIIEQSGAQLPTLSITDWPDFAVRGVLIDVSRDKVPQLETLFALVDMLASWKINQLQLYTEHTFAYSQHQAVWADASPLTGQKIEQLDAYCRQRFIELVPNQNTFGHMERWLRHPNYAPLAETHSEFNTPWGITMQGPFSLCPDDPGSLALIRDLLDELLPHFSSRMVNINCDETVDLGQGRSQALCQQLGNGRVYLDFLLQIVGLVRDRGRIPQFWGDIIVTHPELIGELPHDALVLLWGYEANHPFATQCAQFAASGMPFYVCPGTSSWCSIAGRSSNALGNLRAAAEHGLRHGAQGYLITDWGDRGHWQQLPVSYLGFVAGAAYSWAWEANRDIEVARVASQFAFRDVTGVMGKLAYDLGDIYRMMGDTTPNGTALFWTLQLPLDAPLPHDPLSDEGLQRARDALDAAAQTIERVHLIGPDAAQLIAEFTQTIGLLHHACRRAALRLHPEQRTTAQHSTCAHELGQLIDEQRRLWLGRNRPGGLSDSLARLEQALKDYHS
ncbi:MAG: family 20 glycosylhydrolase [Chloroflexales bacterium]|nr:family 20 glycosylhydrolase [Chloroflexales bacterium]